MRRWSCTMCSVRSFMGCGGLRSIEVGAGGPHLAADVLSKRYELVLTIATKDEGYRFVRSRRGRALIAKSAFFPLPLETVRR